MPRRAKEYADLLKKKIEEHEVDCWLVNTGWSGGRYGQGKRMPISVTRKIISGIHDGTLKKCEYREHAYTGLKIPVQFNGVDEDLLSPEKSWKSLVDYEKQAQSLMEEFEKKSADIKG